MTPEEIKKQMMGSAGIKEEDANSLYDQANAAMDAEDHATAFRLAIKAADMGHARAQNLTGMCYISGCGVGENPQAALAYFRKAADSGDPQSKSWLAMMSTWGDAPDISPGRAAQLLTEAVDAGSVDDAFANLGTFYLHGRGVEKDVPKAITLFEEGLRRNDSTAMLEMAKCYAQGVGVDRNLPKALELATSAKKRGLDAAAELAAELENEIGCRKPDSKLRQLGESSQSPALKELKERTKSMVIAIVLAVFFGPLGLFYVSWKRALIMLLVFIVGVSLIPNNGFVTLLLWLVAPVASIFVFGLGSKQSEPQPDEAFWSGSPPSA
jgi:hypothetical protein